MIAGKLLKRTVLLIGLAGLVISAAPQSDVTALQPDLGYDLLFLVTPPLPYLPSPSHADYLFHLDTATGEITLLDITDRPVSRNALSPDGQHLAVFRGRQLCLVDRAWETQFCLPAGAVDPVIAEPDMYYSKIYWSPDGQSFWTPTREGNYFGMSEISASDGSTCAALVYNLWPIYLFDFSPISKNIIYTLGNDVYNMETRTRLYSGLQNDVGALSPDGRRFAEVLTWTGQPQEILHILELGDEERHSNRNAEGETWVRLDNTWSNTELASPPDSLGIPTWSHDGHKIAMQLGGVFPSSVSSGIFSQSTTAVYFLDTQELHFLSVDDAQTAYVVWSPDDTALARVLIHETSLIQGLSIATLDGEVYPVSIEGFFPPVEDPLYLSYDAITWLPRGWLDVDAFAARSAEEAAQ